MNKEFNRDKLAIIAQGKLHELYELGLPGVDAITLYTFYYYTSNWQHTRQAKATGKYCWTKLGWSNRRFYQAKKILAEKGLIIEVQKSQKGVFSEVYIKLPFKATETTTANVLEHQRTADVPDRTAVENTTNTPNVNNINTPSVDILEEDEDYKNNFSNETAGVATDCGNDVTGEKGELQPELDTLPKDSNRTNTELINAIIALAKEQWVDEDPERITPVTRENIAKRLKEGFTLEDFTKAIDMSTFWSASVPKTLAVLVRNKQSFNGFVTFQDRVDERARAAGVTYNYKGMRVSVQE